MVEALDLLERLNVTLGAMRSVIESRSTNVDLEERLDGICDALEGGIAMLKQKEGDSSDIDRLVRLNRELSEQLEAVRTIVRT